MRGRNGSWAAVIAIAAGCLCGAAAMATATPTWAEPATAMAGTAEPVAAPGGPAAPAEAKPGPAVAPAAPAAKTAADADDWPIRRDTHDPPAVAIIVPTVFFATILVIVLGAFYAGFRRDRERHQSLRLAIERGAEIPPELLTPPKRPASDLRRGVLLIAAGVGLLIVLAATPTDAGVWTAGLIPLLLGLAYLVVWKLERPGAPLEPPRPASMDYRS